MGYGVLIIEDEAILAKKQLPKRTTVQEGVFEQSQAAAELPNRKY